MSAALRIEGVAAPGSAVRIGRNVVFRLGAQAASALVNVLGMVVLGRALAPAGYGDYVFYYALIPLIASIGDMGVGVIVTREMARDPREGARLLGDGLAIKGMMAVALLVPTVAYALAHGSDLAPWALTGVAAAALLDFSQDPGVWVARAHERQEFEAILLLVSQLLWLAGIVACVRLHAGLPWLLGVAGGAFLLRLVVSLAFVTRRFHRPLFRPDLARWRSLIAQGAPVALAMGGVALYGRIGILALKALGSSTDVAYFNVAYMLSQPLGFVSTAITMAVFPAIARQAQGPDAGSPTALRGLVKCQLLGALPLAVGQCVLSDRVIPLLFHGGDFAGAAAALRIMSLGLPLVFLNLMSRYTLAALDRQRTYLYAVVVGLVTNVAISLLTIPRLGYSGAALAFLGTELAILLMCRRAMPEAMSWRALATVAIRPLAAAMGMGALVWWARQWPLPLVVIGGALVFGALLLGSGALSAEERGVVRRVVGSFATAHGTGLAAAREER